MKRLISMALAAVLVLAVAAVAVAHRSSGQPEPTKEVTATFTATPIADKTKTTQCTGVDGTYAITKSVAKGTADGDDDRLDGNITIKSKSVVNTTATPPLGWTEGKVTTTDPVTGKLKGVSGFTAVIKADKLEGFVAGKVKDPAAAAPKAKKNGNHEHGKRGANLRANFAATVAQDGTIAGKLGGGGGDNTAIISGNPCSPPQNTSQNEGEGRNNDGRHGDDNKGDDHKGGRGDGK
jgi:hypothetical protein